MIHEATWSKAYCRLKGAFWWPLLRSIHSRCSPIWMASFTTQIHWISRCFLLPTERLLLALVYSFFITTTSIFMFIKLISELEEATRADEEESAAFSWLQLLKCSRSRWCCRRRRLLCFYYLQTWPKKKRKRRCSKKNQEPRLIMKMCVTLISWRLPFVTFIHLSLLRSAVKLFFSFLFHSWKELLHNSQLSTFQTLSDFVYCSIFQSWTDDDDDVSIFTLRYLSPCLDYENIVESLIGDVLTFMPIVSATQRLRRLLIKSF